MIVIERIPLFYTCALCMLNALVLHACSSLAFYKNEPDCSPIDQLVSVI